MLCTPNATEALPCPHQAGGRDGLGCSRLPPPPAVVAARPPLLPLCFCVSVVPSLAGGWPVFPGPAPCVRPGRGFFGGGVGECVGFPGCCGPSWCAPWVLLVARVGAPGALGVCSSRRRAARGCCCRRGRLRAAPGKGPALSGQRGGGAGR